MSIIIFLNKEAHSTNVYDIAAMEWRSRKEFFAFDTACQPEKENQPTEEALLPPEDSCFKSRDTIIILWKK